jgi:hypothetical protein
MATSLQPGAKGKNCVGQLIHSALSLQGVLGYNVGKVLNTPLTAAYITSVNSDFFTSKDYLLWSGSEQEYKTRKGNIVGRLLAVFKYPINPLNKGSHEQTNRRPYHG